MGKNTTPADRLMALRALDGNSLLLLFLRGEGRLGGLRFGGALLELVHAAGGIHEFLLAGVKRMAHVANTDDDDRPGGAGLDHVAAGATDFGIHILRMNVCFHKRPHKIAPMRMITSGKLREYGVNPKGDTRILTQRRKEAEARSLQQKGTKETMQNGMRIFEQERTEETEGEAGSMELWIDGLVRWVPAGVTLETFKRRSFTIPRLFHDLPPAMATT